MNAIDFLLKEHEKVRKILADISDESHRVETREKKFEMLCQELIRHETMEQKIWYPYFKNNSQLTEIINHLISEEKSAHTKIKKFNTIKTETEWKEKFSELKKDIEHHATEEETKLFPLVNKLLNDMDLERIGKEMHQFKEEYILTLSPEDNLKRLNY